MITNTLFEIPITNRNVSAFKNLGYQVKSGSSYLIKLEDCPGKIAVTCKCDKCGIYYTVTKGRLNETNSKFCKEHRWEVYSETRKEYWNSDEGIKIRKTKGPKISKSKKGIKIEACSGPKNGRWNPNKSERNKYYYSVRSFTNKTFKEEVDNLPNRHLSGICGVKGAYQLDHRVSIKYGFENGVPPEIIGHICNLEMIPWEKNRSKDSKNSIDLDMLFHLIEEYDRKH